jgi:hypothetical protein
LFESTLLSDDFEKSLFSWRSGVSTARETGDESSRPHQQLDARTPAAEVLN